MERSSPKHRKGHELEAKEACDWLRAAGFPQYAQFYEASLFPIEISAVRRDHEFLDHDSLKALCRRLTTLNKCAAMSLEVHFQCKRQSEDSEEDDACALSSRWAFQRESKTWSRIRTLSPNPVVPGNRTSTLRPSGSSDSVLSDNSLLDITSLTSDLSTSSLSLDSTRETTSPDVAGVSSSPVCVSTSQDENDEAGSSSSLPSVREKAKRPSRTFLRRRESVKKKATAPASVLTVSQHQPPSGLHCTSDTSLPGQTANKCRNTKDVTWKSHTICRSNISQQAPLHKPHRTCLYLEDYLLTWEMPKLTNHNRQRKEDRVVHLPFDHKPGTFPKSLSIESICPVTISQSPRHIDWTGEDGDFSLEGSISHSGSQDLFSPGFGKRRNSVSSIGSIYDNVPEAPDRPCDTFDPGKDETFQHLDDILQHVHGLQHNIDEWSRSLGIQQLDQSNAETESTADATLASSLINSLNFDERSMSDVGTTASDYDSGGNSMNEGEGGMRERRDSGVGASLTRPSRKLRWHSFQNSHRPSVTSASLEINRQSAAQLNLLQKFSLLRLTAILEKHTDTSKHGWNWVVPKFMKRSKVPDYKDKHVFGVPPIVNVQRTGQPLPQSIQQAMRYLRSQCLEKVGIFRKSGVKSRIQALRQLNENSPDHVSYQGQSAYDVADLIKQYFRDLPEPVLTSKLTDTFLHIYQFVPAEQRLQAVQAAVILLPDENREVLQTLLYFLSDIASAQDNQMTADSLAVCLAPSVLHLNTSKKDGTSPRLISKKGGAKPDHKELSENMAATQCLSHMITECKKLFQIPHEMMLQSRNSYVAADAQPLPLHGLGVNALGEPVDYRAYLEDNIQCLLREASERSKGWHHAHGPDNTELAYKKVGDGHPMRLWRVSVEMEAPPAVVLQRILRERHLWDEDLLHSRVIETLENNTEVFHYITDSMAPHPRRNFIVLRRWCSDLPKGVCVLVSSSVEHDNVQLEAGLRAVLLTSRILIEPCGMGRSRLTHYCRADLRGRSPDWYNKVFGHLCAMEAARIRSSFPVLSARGPETKL
ncbi:stAR-related lipid transfer protein 8 isoform X3 [Triplophysa rosa]|nr:stAR-related lipid transfer protein 8 isoform X3 [Triplophysa rosa]